MSSAQRYVPYAFARDNSILLRPQTERDAEAWVSEATPLAALNEVMRVFPGRVTPVMVDTAALRDAIAQTYAAGEGSAQQIVGDIEGEFDISRMLAEVPDIEDLLETEDDAPIIRMINALLTQAAREGASDIHIEPFETYSLVRFRVDGTLRDIVRPKRALHAALVSRIKIMAQLDIAEKRLPQDGRITLRVGGRAVDVRVSTLPTGHGERAVLRLLEKDLSRLNLESLGMAERTRAGFDKLIHQPHGILLVTGPTGSGKTTTLYGAIRRLDHSTTNIMTVEDPIEYDLEGIGQTQVNPKIDMTFARALRSILRQDPDVVMVGEIRDLETAQIAVQASLTGHLVLATLHTNDAASAVTRRARPAARAQAVPALQEAGSRRQRLRSGRLRHMQPHRLYRPHRHLRAAECRRADAAADPPGGQRHRYPSCGRARRHDVDAQRRPALGPCRRDRARGSGAGDPGMKMMAAGPPATPATRAVSSALRRSAHGRAAPSPRP
jgi:general secretion pathway protein E